MGMGSRLLLPRSSLGGKQTPWDLPQPFKNTGLLVPHLLAPSLSGLAELQLGDQSP